MSIEDLIDRTRPDEVITTRMVDAMHHDPVNHPSHYTSHPTGIEAIDITEHFNFNTGNAIKYLWRADHKNPDPLEDLKKARWYCDREIARLQKFGVRT